MWAILFDSISVFPLKGRARANEEKLMDFKNRDGKTPSPRYFGGVGEIASSFRKRVGREEAPPTAQKWSALEKVPLCHRWSVGSF